ELKLKHTKFLTTSHELSGLFPQGVELLAVSDAKDDTFVFKLVDAGDRRLKLVPHLDLTKLDGFSAYQKSLHSNADLKKKNRRFDLEGIAACGDTIFLVNERARDVLVIEKGK